MKQCPILRPGILGIGLCAAVFALDLQAQEAGDQTQPALPPPVSLVPSSGPAGGGSDRQVPDIVSEGVIAVRDLEAVSTDSLGLLDALNGGLGVDMWEGTTKELVDALFPRLPDQMASPAARRLMQTLLLSIARPPQSEESEDVFVDMTAIVPSAIGFTPEVNGQSNSNDALSEQPDQIDLGILERRVAQLARIGDWSNVRALLELVPMPALTESIRQLQTDLFLVEGNVGAACADAGEQIVQSEAPYWQKVFAFCQLREGNTAGAFLTMDLLRETGGGDPAFFWAAELMSGNRPITPNGLRRLTPLQLAMLRYAGRPFPIQMVDNRDPTLLRVMAEAEPLYIMEEGDDPELVEERRREAIAARLQAAEHAVALGVLDAESLHSLYRDEAVEQEVGTHTGEPPAAVDEPVIAETQSADENAEEEAVDLSDLPVDTALARARLFNLAEEQIIPTARAEAVSRAIDFARADRGRNGPNVAGMGLIFSNLLVSLPTSGDLNWFAGNAARALLSSGETGAGQTWLDLTRLYARTSIEAAEVSAAMWPIERQFQPTMTNRFTPLRFKRWEDTRPSGLVAGDKTLILTTFAALGDTVTSMDWIDIMDGPSRQSIDMPRPHIWNGLVNAANNGRIGETVLLALITLGGDDLTSVSPIVLAHVISALMTVGLEADARQLAVEAAAVRGL